MPITEFLERNARLHPNGVALVEINPANQPDSALPWHEYQLIQSTSSMPYRKELTWREFDTRANRFANLLLTRGIKKGDKVAILMMNCLDWLPIYFGILKAGAIAVPMNFRFSAEEIAYCTDLADIEVLVFGPEFIDRIDSVRAGMRVSTYFFVGEENELPTFADPCLRFLEYCSSVVPAVEIHDEDDGALYFSSGTT